jgi:hypothetical protein
VTDLSKQDGKPKVEIGNLVVGKTNSAFGVHTNVRIKVNCLRPNGVSGPRVNAKGQPDRRTTNDYAKSAFICFEDIVSVKPGGGTGGQ